VSRAREFALSAVFASLCASLPAPLLAQIADRPDAQSDAQDARNDALLATPNQATLRAQRSRWAGVSEVRI
jgi:hypothetical protein